MPVDCLVLRICQEIALLSIRGLKRQTLQGHKQKQKQNKLTEQKEALMQICTK